MVQFLFLKVPTTGPNWFASLVIKPSQASLTAQMIVLARSCGFFESLDCLLKIMQVVFAIFVRTSVR